MPKVPAIVRKARLAQAYNRLLNNPARYPYGMGQRMTDLDELYRNGFFDDGFEPAIRYGRPVLRRAYDDFEGEGYEYMPFGEYVDTYDTDAFRLNNFIPPEFESVGPRGMELVEDPIVFDGGRLTRREVDDMNRRIDQWLEMNRRRR